MSFISLAVMAKAPHQGDPKTRLQPPLDAAQARRLAAAFLCDTVRMAQESGAEVHVACTPAAGVSEVAELTGLPLSRIFAQEGHGLSARCRHAFEALFVGGAEAALLVGADTPHLPPAILMQAVGELARPEASSRLLLGPSDDGGYYLIGLRREHRSALPLLLDGMTWSTDSVYAETVRRAQTAGLAIMALPACYDIDTPADLYRLQRELSAEAEATIAPHTRAVLASLSLTHDPITI